MSPKPVLLPFGKTIYQTDQGQSITSDNTYLVELILESEDQSPLQVIDLGCGNGILSIMLAHYRPDWQISGLEIQPHLVKLARENCESAETANISIFQQDLRHWKKKDQYDLIFSNPPYYPEVSGRVSPVREKAISRHEITCSMKDILDFVKKYLKSSGKAYLIYPSTRTGDMEKYAKKVDLNVEAEFFFNKNKKEKIVFLLTQRK